MKTFTTGAGSRRSFFKTGLASALTFGLLGRGGGASPATDAVEQSNTGPWPRPMPIAPPPAVPGFAAAQSVGMESGYEEFFEAFKQQATPEELYRFLYALPKGGDIHHHLAGGFIAPLWYQIATDKSRNGNQTFYTRYRILNDTMDSGAPQRRPSPNLYYWLTIRESAYRELSSSQQAEFMPLPNLSPAQREAWISSIKLDRVGEGREEFFEYTWPRLNHLITSIHVNSELCVENMKLLGAEGVRYLELMAPFGIWHDGQGKVMDAELSNQFWRDRLNQSDALDTGVIVRFKTMILRFADDAEAQAAQHFEWVHRHRDLWVGVDMAGREDNNRGHPQRFTATFDALRSKYPEIKISIHAGEAEKPDTNIFDTLRLGATRIGHGVNLISDAQTMQHMCSGRYLIEINLVSNHVLEYVPDMSKHPFPIYLRQGIPCCLNTDDRGMWDSNMTDEYYVAVSRFNLSWRELVQLARNSLQFAFVQDSVKTSLQRDYESRLAAFMANVTPATWRRVLPEVPAVTYGYGERHLGLKF